MPLALLAQIGMDARRAISLVRAEMDGADSLVDLDDIWLPGVTTAPDGTGFGLTIVRDSVNDLGGDVQAIPHVDFGGAEFIVRLPPMRRLFE